VLGGHGTDNFVELVMLVVLIGAVDDADGVDGVSIWICERYY
jgi:hypothetical protein